MATETKKKPDITDSQVIEDGVKLLKTDFVNLYVGLGYDKIYAAAAWHNVRISTRGRELLDKRNKPGLQPHFDIISDIPAEIEERKLEAKMTKKTTTKAAKEPKVPAPAVEQEPAEPSASPTFVAEEKKAKAADKKIKPAKPAKVEEPAKEEPAAAAPGELVRGDKTRIAKEMIAAGETDAAKIVAATGINKLYCQTLMRNAKKGK